MNDEKIMRDMTETMNVEDMRLCYLAAQRAYEWALDYKTRNKRDDLIDPDKMMFFMDICLAHYYRSVKLLEWLSSDDFAFIADFTTIEKSVNRGCALFPLDVRLRFARLGASSPLYLF
jgi:hypothetical protein